MTHARTVAALLLLATLPMAHADVPIESIDPLARESTSENSVCPLSDEQVKRSGDAFSKIAAVFSGEPRCANCHGGVDPFKPGSGTHFGNDVEKITDCNICHSGMLPRSDGSQSDWNVAKPEHAFVGKDSPTLCRQMKNVFKVARDFIGHLTDDNGHSNFTGTAFLGNRGLPLDTPGLVRMPPSSITAGGLVALGHEWVGTMGNEFQGDEACGCVAAKYALRVSIDTTLDVEGIHMNMFTPPVDIPLTFHDDGTFEGEATLVSNGGLVGAGCTAEGSGSMPLQLKGRSSQTWRHNLMSFELTNRGTARAQASAQCYDKRGRGSGSGPAGPLNVQFQMTGIVGEKQEVTGFVSEPDVDSIMHVQLVKLGR